MGENKFDWYFNPQPANSPTAEEIAEKERIEKEGIEKRFWEGLEEHIIEIDDRPNYIYTERKEQPSNGETCVVFSDIGEGDPDAKIFILTRPTSLEDNKKTQNDFGKMDEEEMKYLNDIQKEIMSNIDSKGNPNKINVSERGRYVTIGGGKYFFFYVPKGSGVGTDAVKDIKRRVGMRNR